MSVIVKRDNLIMLLTKGADEVLLPRLAKTVNNEIWSKTKRQLHRYASKGLRTLLLARRIIP